MSSGGQVGASKTPALVVARDPDGYLFEIERDEQGVKVKVVEED